MKKILATFLALVMVLSSLCLPAVANQTTPTNADVTLTQADFVADANDYDGDENTTEMLARAKVEKALASKDDAVILLGENVTVTVTANTVFPLLAETFYGSFYGDGNTITFEGDNVACTFGDSKTSGVLFNQVGNSANIDNDYDATEGSAVEADANIYDLTVTGLVATIGDGSQTGAQFGVVAGQTGRVLTMNNVHISADITRNSTGTTNVGGFIGKTNNTSYFYDCSFNGTIGIGTAVSTVAGTSGGIVGGAVQAVTMEGCTVNKNNQTNGSIAGYSRAGGLIGLVNTTKTIAITKQCEVYGTVTTPAGVAGGLIGAVESSAVVNMSRSQTEYSPTNYATVSGPGNLGGIIGKVAGASNISPKITMNMVINKGTVDAGTEGGSNAGGIIGLVEKVAVGSNEYNIHLKNTCLNTGDVTGKNFVGGAIGRLRGAGAVVKIDDYVSTGAITSGAFAGGIVGMSDGSSDTLAIIDTINLGAVDAVRYAGGILGHHRTSAAKSIAITGCVNMGTVNTDGATDVAYSSGGIVGGTAIASTAFEISDCLNFGVVTNEKVTAGTAHATSIAGGIHGTITAGNADIIKNNTDLTASGTTTAVANSALLAMGEEGKAQIRLSNDKADAGIRFAVDTNSAVLAALTTAGYTYKLGSLIATDANIGEGALTKDALGNKKYSAKTEGVQVNDDRYMVAVNDIEEAYYAEAVRCAGIIELTKDGTTYTIYTEASLAKSLADVAQAALDDQDTEAQAKYAPYKTTLEDFAAVLNSAE